MKEELKAKPPNWDEWLYKSRPYLNLTDITDPTRVPVYALSVEDCPYPEPPPLPEGIIIPISQDDEETISFTSPSEDSDSDLGEGEILGMY